MNVAFFSPEGGSMPMPENVPTLLQQPISNLKNLSCIAGVISGQMQADASFKLHLDFCNNATTTDFISALACLNGTGYIPRYMNINRALRFMDLRLETSKTLTH